MLKTILKGIKLSKNQQIIVAYEPIWAIGTGIPIDPPDAVAMHKLIRRHLQKLMGRGRNIPIIYGGSVKPANARQFLEHPEIEGSLVGGASIRHKDFVEIINIAKDVV